MFQGSRGQGGLLGPFPMETYQTCDWKPIEVMIFQLTSLPTLDLRMTLLIHSMYLFGLIQIILNSKYGIFFLYFRELQVEMYF